MQMTRLLLTALLISGVAQASENLLQFKTVDVYGQVVDLAQLENQWVVVNFWATWCKPCRKEIPELSALHDERDDVTLLGLAFEEIALEQIHAFLQEFPASYPVALVDTYNPPAQFGTPMALPTTLIISPAGQSVRKIVGPVTREMIEAEIARHLANG